MELAFMRRQVEPVPEAETSVWSCTDEGCAGWMRSDFSFDEEPECPLCHNRMAKEVRVLPEIKW